MRALRCVRVLRGCVRACVHTLSWVCMRAYTISQAHRVCVCAHVCVWCLPHVDMRTRAHTRTLIAVQSPLWNYFKHACTHARTLVCTHLEATSSLALEIVQHCVVRFDLLSSMHAADMRTHACVRKCVHGCVRACVRACVCACVRARRCYQACPVTMTTIYKSTHRARIRTKCRLPC